MDTDKPFVVRQLDQQHIEQAYALACLDDSVSCLEAWRWRVDQCRNDHVSGWAYVSDRKGYMRSLFHYTVDQDTPDKRALVVDSLLSPSPRSTRMLEEIRSWTMRHASNCACQTIRIVDPEQTAAT